MLPQELAAFSYPDELSWVVKLKIGEARGLQCKDVFHPDQPASLFCGISLLLEGTNFDDGMWDHDVHPLSDAANGVEPYKIELQRSTELRTVTVHAETRSVENNGSTRRSSPENSDEEDFQIFVPDTPDSNPPHKPNFRSSRPKVRARGASAPEKCLCVDWGEEFSLGVSHPDICSDDDDMEVLSDHRELRPRLGGEALQLLVTVHAIDAAGCVATLGQVARRSAKASLAAPFLALLRVAP
jgi:hypothetical protein